MSTKIPPQSAAAPGELWATLAFGKSEINPEMKASEEVYALIQSRGRELMQKSEAELRTLVDANKKEAIVIQNKKFEITQWAEEDEKHGALAVIVEARRNPISWLAWSQVSAFGFFAFSDGSKEELQEHDYYEHGY